MDRPSKKQIKAAIDKLKEKPEGQTEHDSAPAKLTPKHSSKRIRKQGV